MLWIKTTIWYNPLDFVLPSYQADTFQLNLKETGQAQPIINLTWPSLFLNPPNQQLILPHPTSLDLILSTRMAVCVIGSHVTPLHPSPNLMTSTNPLTNPWNWKCLNLTSLEWSYVFSVPSNPFVPFYLLVHLHRLNSSSAYTFTSTSQSFFAFQNPIFLRLYLPSISLHPSPSPSFIFMLHITLTSPYRYPYHLHIPPPKTSLIPHFAWPSAS